MTRKLAIVLLLIVCLPLLLLAWLGARLVRDQQTMMRQQLRELLAEQLHDTDQLVQRYFQQREAEFLTLTTLQAYDSASIRVFLRSQPRVTQLFVQNANGDLLHPDVDQPLNQSERDFLERASTILTDKDLVRAAANLESDTPLLRDNGMTHGWHIWYWGRGVNLIFWRRDDAGNIVAVELDRARWISDLIAELPQSSVATRDEIAASSSRIQLVDSNGQVVYQWGNYEPGDKPAFVESPVSAPLTSWRLKYFVADETLAAGSKSGLMINLIAGLVVVAICLAGLAAYFYRESSRELREAATRVNFVNQVSHELKTPLTNIRMYADLLHDDLSTLENMESRKPMSRLQVIVSESQRLSRLIGNVLTFARQQRGHISLDPTEGRIDDVIRGVLGRFAPVFSAKSIEVTLNAGAENDVKFDRDSLEQVLTNLLSNVEKYAADGRQLRITSSQVAETTKIVIADNGPGIPRSDHERIFEPFYRGCDKLESATGAGIGLSIARSLARQHGGDVILLDSDKGARFEVTLRTESAAG